MTMKKFDQWLNNLLGFKNISIIQQGKKYQDLNNILTEDNQGKIGELHWMLDYSKHNYDVADQAIKTIEDKAGFLIKYIGDGVIVLFLSKTFSQNTGFWFRSTIIFGSFLWVISILISLASKKPLDMAVPSLIRYAHRHYSKYGAGDVMKGVLAINFEKAAVIMRERGKEKGRLVKIANCLLSFAFLFLIVSLFFRLMSL